MPCDTTGGFRCSGFASGRAPRRSSRRSTSRPWRQVCNHSARTAVGYPMYPLGPTCTPSAWSGPLKHSITSLRIPRRGDTLFFVRSATDVVQQSNPNAIQITFPISCARYTKRFAPGIRTLNRWMGGLCQSSPTALRSVTITG